MHGLFAIALLGVLAQSGQPTPLGDVLHADRVKADTSRLIMFNTANDTATRFTLVNRAIGRTQYDGKAAIRVHEENRALANAVTIYIDAASLKPLFYESRTGDTLSVTASIGRDSMRIIETRHGIVTKSAIAASPALYFSNSFSELLQANDFGAHPRISFSSVTPGGPANTFTVERIGRRTFGRGLNVWVLKFTRTDASESSVPAGYRYVDANTGRVLFFATELDSPSRFSYQVLPLK